MASSDLGTKSIKIGTAETLNQSLQCKDIAPSEQVTAMGPQTGSEIVFTGEVEAPFVWDTGKAHMSKT